MRGVIAACMGVFARAGVHSLPCMHTFSITLPYLRAGVLLSYIVLFLLLQRCLYVLLGSEVIFLSDFDHCF